MDEPAIVNLIREHEKWLVRNNSSPATLRIYRYAADEFSKHLNRYGVTMASQLGREHVEGFMDALIDRRLSPGTRQSFASWLRGFLQWSSQRTESMHHNLWMSVGRVKVPPRLARPLDPGDIQKIIVHFNAMTSPKPVDLRDKALFLTLFSTGLRVSEVLQMRRRDPWRVAVVRQKGSKPRTVEVHPVVQKAIRDYLATRTDDHPALWVTYRSNMPTDVLEPAGMREMFQKVAKRASVPVFTTHQLRHTTATRLSDEGVPDSLIADYLGHGDIDSVRQYIDTRNRRREAMDAMGRILESTAGTGAEPDLERLADELEAVTQRVRSGQLASLGDDFVQHSDSVVARLRARTATPTNGEARQTV